MFESKLESYTGHHWNFCVSVIPLQRLTSEVNSKLKEVGMRIFINIAAAAC